MSELGYLWWGHVNVELPTDEEANHGCEPRVRFHHLRWLALNYERAVKTFQRFFISD